MSKESARQPGNIISVIIVDDHRIFRQGIQMNLELHEDIKVVGQCPDGEHALEVIREKQPDVAIMDINMPRMNGIQVTRTLSTQRSPVRVIMVTAYDDPEQTLHAMRAGAAAFCPKEIDPDRLVYFIREVVNGKFVVDDRVMDEAEMKDWIAQRVEAVAGPYYADQIETFTPLSPREMEILQYVTQGMSNREIAQHLRISHQTVKNHMTSILRKLAVEDRTQAAVFALRQGWVRLHDVANKPDVDDN